MSYIKFTPAHLGDSRWLEVSADAFAVHVWALDYSNKMLLDGRIAKTMAARLALPVPAERTTDAIQSLLDAGFWLEVGGKYVIDEYETHALSAAEITATRQRWADDQRRRRKHGNGVHDECNAAKCPYLMSHADTRADSTAESRTKTRPNKTDQTFRSGSGNVDPAPASAARIDDENYAPHRFISTIDDPEHCGHCGRRRTHPHLEVVA